VVLDGKIFSTDRCDEKTTSVKGKQVDLWCSGKAHEHGGNIQTVMEPDGFPLWVADVEPGSVHDLELPTLSDGGYEGAGIGVHTPLKQPAGDQVLDVDNRTYNTLLRGLRCLDERGFALLTGRWRTLHHITASPRKIGDIVKAHSRRSTPY
jgi:hypothetical protein